MLVPMAIALAYSFLTPSPYGGVERPFSTASYLRILYDRDFDGQLVFDPTYLIIFARSVLQAGTATIACIVIGLPLAWWTATRPQRQQKVLVLLITVPFWTNLLIRTYCWVLILRDNGLVNQALLATHLTAAPVTFLYSDRRGAARTGLRQSAIHGAADLCGAGEGRPAPDRSRPRPLRHPTRDLPTPRLAAGTPRRSSRRPTRLRPGPGFVSRTRHSRRRPQAHDRHPDPAGVHKRARLVVWRRAIDCSDGGRALSWWLPAHGAAPYGQTCRETVRLARYAGGFGCSALRRWPSSMPRWLCWSSMPSTPIGSRSSGAASACDGSARPWPTRTCVAPR